MEPRTEKSDAHPHLIKEDLLWGAPKTSDAEFLVSMRERLNRQPMGVWMTSRRTALAVGLAALLLVGVWFPGSMNGTHLLENLSSLDETVDDFAYDESDPTGLADYLGVSGQFDDSTVDYDVSLAGVSTAELLALEPQELDSILSELQETNFF